jgi:hypothetical protein
MRYILIIDVIDVVRDSFLFEALRLLSRLPQTELVHVNLFNQNTILKELCITLTSKKSCLKFLKLCRKNADEFLLGGISLDQCVCYTRPISYFKLLKEGYSVKLIPELCIQGWYGYDYKRKKQYLVNPKKRYISFLQGIKDSINLKELIGDDWRLLESKWKYIYSLDNTSNPSDSRRVYTGNTERTSIRTDRKYFDKLGYDKISFPNILTH